MRVLSSLWCGPSFRLIALMGLSLSILLCSNATPSIAITQETGANVDASTLATPACATLGFSVETTITLPTGQNNIRMLRVDQTANNPFGYAVTETATGYTVTAFDLRSMVQISSTTRVITGYNAVGRLQGDIGTDGKLYLFNLVTNANPGCPASSCVMFSRFNVTSLENSVVDGTGIALSNIDDARQSNSQFLVSVASLAGARQFRTYSMSALTQTATGTLTGASAFGHISRTIDGRMYAGLAITAAPNSWTFPTDSPTADNSNNFTFGTRLLSALYPILQSPSNLITFDSDTTGGITAQRVWVNASTFIDGGPGTYSGGLADSASLYQGTFYDQPNNKVFSARNTGGNAIFLRTTPGQAGFTTEQNYNGCGAPCVNGSGTSTGTQIVDYSQRYARLYFGSNESPARVSKIKVCATGGP